MNTKIKAAFNEYCKMKAEIDLKLLSIGDCFLEEEKKADGGEKISVIDQSRITLKGKQ